MLITGLRLPNITDRPDTLLFDWEDFQVAGGLDKLAETIAIRQRFETERNNLTAESKRQEVRTYIGMQPSTGKPCIEKTQGGRTTT